MYELPLCPFPLTKCSQLLQEEKEKYIPLLNRGIRLETSLCFWLVWAIICCSVKESACQSEEKMSNLKTDCKLHLTDWQSNQLKLRGINTGHAEHFLLTSGHAAAASSTKWQIFQYTKEHRLDSLIPCKHFTEVSLGVLFPLLLALGLCPSTQSLFKCLLVHSIQQFCFTGHSLQCPVSV